MAFISDLVKIIIDSHFYVSCAVAFLERSATLPSLPLLTTFITSGPQERPDLHSDVLCSIALHVRTRPNGAI